MSGHCSGVQRRIKEIAPQAEYVHCYAHCLNLVLVDTTRKVPNAYEFFELIELLYIFVSTIKVHCIYLKKQADLHPEKKQRQLQRLSNTRWTCRFNAVDAICSTYDSILTTLKEVADNQDQDKAIQATGILIKVQSFKFLLSLIVFHRIFSFTTGLSEQLQSIEIGMGRAAELVSAIVDTLQELRSDYKWEHIFKYVQNVAKLHSVSLEPQRPPRPKRLPSRLDGVIMETTGARDTMNTSEGYKVSFYFPVLDAILAEFNYRFNDKNLEYMRSIQCCNPLSSQFLRYDGLLPFAKSYGINITALSFECELARRMLKDKILNSIAQALQELYLVKTAFPELVQLFQIALTIPVSTSSCERTFSALKRIKTYLRSSMSENRLNSMAILSIERDLSCNMPFDDVVKDFA